MVNAAILSVVAAAQGHVDGISGTDVDVQPCHARQRLVEPERLPHGIIYLPSLHERAVGLYVGHHCHILFAECIVAIPFKRSGHVRPSRVVLNASAEGHTVGGEPVGRYGIGIRAGQFVHRRQAQLVSPVMNAEHHEGTLPVVLYKVEHPCAPGQRLKMKRKVGSDAVGRYHPRVHRQAFGRPQGVAAVLFVQQVAGVRDTETVAGGIVNRKTYGGGRVGKHHLANPQFAACHIQASQRIRVLHNASGADGNGHGKEAAQENHRQLSHECVNVFIVI